MNNKKSIVLSKIKEIVRQIDPQAEVILYGSRARGDERPDSDWDLLILVNSKADLDYEMVFRHKLFDLELELEQSFSVTVHNKNEWESKYWVTPLYQSIAREGLRI
ncbi:MAG TPA: nucleotidyltransferase domain-containing protein [Bacteroidales bacterium]|nr:nucleotidyltransferase domain-containing protein [Bacteroidales bacterium]HCI56376.1 nucleotidyltransferase domain-containing protein [Bacteroidales bacterium]HOU95703.1 nucleotidyltransferase domain-containing protein [Bacteroidales bacterium]HQG37342.1 nucleotidyltransferase domain-containing protein [Bacteroidales bacterium]HQG52128.1 nucleotidyltransferase domain-containing protein [Bacteroidales bacterium]